MKEKPFFVFAPDRRMTKVAFGITGEVHRCGRTNVQTILHVVDKTIFQPIISGSINFSSELGLCSLKITPGKIMEPSVVVTIANEYYTISHEMIFEHFRKIVFGAKHEPDLVVKYNLT